MFETLQGKLQQIVSRLTGRGVLSDADVDAALRDVRLALLKADVNVKVAKAFADRVRDAAVGQQLLTHLAPGQQVVKLVHQELVRSDGRQYTADELMAELVTMRDATAPHQVLLVVDAMTGQDAVNIAQRFHDLVGIDGLIVTKLDGDARGGAVLSIVEVTGRPVLFAGVGETLDGLEPFHPDRIASRILGMGDVLTLIERAQDAMDAQTAADLERKLRRAEFTFDDFRVQLRQVRSMGPLDSLLGLLPGAMRPKGAMAGMDDRALRRVEAIIDSMTPDERTHPHLIDGSRRRRIAKGSGTTIQDVNRLLRQFEEARRLVKRMSGLEGKGKRGKLQFPLR